MNKIPSHIAIIMDGNGRWAKERGLKRTMGHAEGAKALEKIIKDADDLGVKYLTVYAFSTENWSRPEDEISLLMQLLDKYLRKCEKMSIKHNFRARVIGDRTALSDSLNRVIDSLEETSRDFTGLNLLIAINYGGRNEIVRGIRKISKRIQSGEITPGDIDEKCLSDALDTADVPDPDLVIRTSGEQRLSNFLLWQLAYAEMYFTDVYWPDFDRGQLEKAIEFYGSRDRKFGNVAEDKI